MLEVLIQNSIWISLPFLVLGIIYSYKGSNRVLHYFFGVGWIFFGLYWLSLPLGFLSINDYFNALLTLLLTLLAWFIAFIEFRHHEEFSKELIFLGKAAGIAGLLYFPYSFLSAIHPTLAQKIVAEQTVFVLSFFNLSISLKGNLILHQGSSMSIIEITYACTGLGSIALFVGAILPSRDKTYPKIETLLVSILVIYFLNILRNVFVVYATVKDLFSGINVFGMSSSFYIAHNIFAKMGSLIALFLIAYYVLTRLPKLQEMMIRILKIPEKIINKYESSY